MCFINGTDFFICRFSLWGRISYVSLEQLLYKFVSCPGGEDETYALTVMFLIIGGLERCNFPPRRTYPENHFQFASLKLQFPWANCALGNICFTIKRGLQRETTLLNLPFERIPDLIYFTCQMCPTVGTFGENIREYVNISLYECSWLLIYRK